MAVYCADPRSSGGQCNLREHQPVSDGQSPLPNSVFLCVFAAWRESFFFSAASLRALLEF
jgi:hypothetical protein